MGLRRSLRPRKPGRRRDSEEKIGKIEAPFTGAELIFWL
jgi:hypothetical protein